jgi:branched-chain amino acid aminotransferase
MQAWLDGRFVEWEKVAVSPLSHGFSRGVAIFEVLNFLNTRMGPAALCLKEHVERFFASATSMRMDLALNREELCEAVLAAARRNEVREGIGKFFAYYPSPGFQPVPRDKMVSIAIFCAGYDFFGYDPSKVSRPLKAAVPIWHKISPASIPVSAKVTGAYVTAYLGAVEMSERGFDEPIFVDGEGFVCEGGTSNQFFVKDGIIRTPTLKRVLPGTTRAVAIKMARESGIQVIESDIRQEELAEFDEAFSTGSVSRLAPFFSINGRVLEAGCPGPVTQAVMASMEKVYRGEPGPLAEWLSLF